MMINYVIKRIIRTPLQYIAVVLITFAFTTTLGRLKITINTQNMQLETLYNNMRINCVFADPNGKTDDISITNTLIDVCLTENYKLSHYIYDPLFKRSLNYINMAGDALLIGVNSNRLDVKLKDLPDSMFQGSDYVIFVNQHSGYKEGDKINLIVRLGDEYEEVTFIVAGIYSGEKSDTIYCPWNVICELAVKLGGQISAESGSFTLTDNRKLTEFKFIANEYFDKVDLSSNGYAKHLLGVALIIHDNEFRTTTLALTQNIKMLSTLLLILYVLLHLIGFLVSFLLIRNRYNEFNLLRRVGVKPYIILYMILFEQSISALIGVICGMSFTRTATGMQIFLLYIFGAITSLLLLFKKSIMRTRNE